MARHGSRTARQFSSFRRAPAALREGTCRTRGVVVGGRPARGAGCARAGPGGRGAAGAVGGDGVAGRVVALGGRGPRCGDRAFAGRDRGGLCGGGAFAGGRRQGGGPAEPAAGRTVGCGRHGVAGLRPGPRPGIDRRVGRSAECRCRERRFGCGGVGRGGRARGVDAPLRGRRRARPQDRRRLRLPFPARRRDPRGAGRGAGRHRPAVVPGCPILHRDRRTAGHRGPGRRLLVPKHPANGPFRTGGAQRVRRRLRRVRRMQPAPGAARRRRGDGGRLRRRGDRGPVAGPRRRFAATVLALGGSGPRGRRAGGLAGRHRRSRRAARGPADVRLCAAAVLAAGRIDGFGRRGHPGAGRGAARPAGRGGAAPRFRRGGAYRPTVDRGAAVAGRPRCGRHGVVPRCGVRGAGRPRRRRGRLRGARGADVVGSAGAAGGRRCAGAGGGRPRRRVGSARAVGVFGGRSVGVGAARRGPGAPRGGAAGRGPVGVAAGGGGAGGCGRRLRAPGGAGLRVRPRLPRPAGHVAAGRGDLRRRRAAGRTRRAGRWVRNTPGVVGRGAARARRRRRTGPDRVAVLLAGGVVARGGRIAGAGQAGPVRRRGGVGGIGGRLRAAGVVGARVGDAPDLGRAAVARGRARRGLVRGGMVADSVERQPHRSRRHAVGAGRPHRRCGAVGARGRHRGAR